MLRPDEGPVYHTAIIQRSTIAAALEAPYALAPAPGAVVGTLVPVAVCVPEAAVALARLADALNPDVADARLAVDWAVALLRTLDTEDAEEAIDADEAADDDETAADDDDAADELTDETDAALDDEADNDDDDDDDDDEAARVADAEDGRGVMDLTVLPDSTTSGGVKLTREVSVSETISMV